MGGLVGVEAPAVVVLRDLCPATWPLGLQGVSVQLPPPSSPSLGGRDSAGGVGGVFPNQKGPPRAP